MLYFNNKRSPYGHDDCMEIQHAKCVWLISEYIASYNTIRESVDHCLALFANVIRQTTTTTHVRIHRRRWNYSLYVCMNTHTHTDTLDTQQNNDLSVLAYAVRVSCACECVSSFDSSSFFFFFSPLHIPFRIWYLLVLLCRYTTHICWIAHTHIQTHAQLFNRRNRVNLTSKNGFTNHFLIYEMPNVHRRMWMRACVYAVCVCVLAVECWCSHMYELIRMSRWSKKAGKSQQH